METLGKPTVFEEMGVNLGLPRALLPSLDNFRNYETTTNHSSFVLNVTIELIDVEGSRREILEAF